MKKCYPLLLVLIFCFAWITNAQNKHSKESNFPSYKGLVMAGYQGWFNCEGDGANRGWTHYQKGKKFEDGSCTIDFWPEMSEYKKQYKTPFKFEDGSAAFLFSSYDESTVDLHFKWMKEYGIDGVFMQRFFAVLESENRLKHADKVLTSALKAANKYGIAICMMYDIGGMDDAKYKLVMEDWKHLVDDLKLTSQGEKTNYLFHNNKPLVALWGISSGGRPTGHIPEIFDIMNFLKNDPVYGGCSIQLGVPSRWRTLGADTKGDPRLLDALKQADIVHPWFVGRYNEEKYENFRKEVIEGDIKWCKEQGKSYAPTVYPGFSWYNMKPQEISNKIPRNKGQFYWKQMAGAISSGAEMLYVAMFDEIDEGTAIMKCAKKVPVGKSVFVPIEKEVPTDHYLWLTNEAAKMLRGETPFSNTMPKRN
jgi:glycoprotein endo-alpha-1,2-mannosidase